MLAPVGANKVTGSGELWVTLTGNTAKFTLQVGGLLADAPHASCCTPTRRASARPRRWRRPTTAIGRSRWPMPPPCWAAAGTALTVSGDTGGGSALALDRYPKAGAYTYSRTFDIDPKVAAAIEERHRGDGRARHRLQRQRQVRRRPGHDVGRAGRSAAPALCGTFVASQMQSVPTGSADTGGGPADSPTALAGFGALSLLGAAGAAAVAFRRRFRAPIRRRGGDERVAEDEQMTEATGGARSGQRPGSRSSWQWCWRWSARC